MSLLEDTRSLPGLETSMSDSEDGALPVGVRGGVSSRSVPCFRSAEAVRTKAVRTHKHCVNQWFVFSKQHYVTLTANHGFEKQNLMMHVNMLYKIVILVKQRHISQRKCPLVFPLMSYNIFYLKHDPTFTKIVVLCDALTCIIKFYFSKP